MKIMDKETFEKQDAFGIGAPNDAFAQYFKGQSYLKPLTVPGASAVFLANVTFEPGCRNNWHIHHAKKGGGQLLICTAGEGWYQEEGKDAVSLTPGTVITIPAEVKHWHGAKADSWFSHIAVEVPGEETSNEWCEPVDDAEYEALLLNESYTLANGVKIPKLGLGTWMIEDDKTAEAVRQAVAVGYRHIDTAQAYGNEAGVGEGIRTCGIPREQLFVTSKVAAEAKSYEAAAKSIDETLAKMKLSYIDMMIIHSPQPWAEWRESDKRYFAENKEVWRALEDAYKAGKVKAIGVSNFLKDDLENILSDCEIPPMVNQILLHIGNTNTELIEFCQQRNILVEAYSPIAHGEAAKNPEIAKIAEKYEVSSAQLCIRYTIQLGAVSLPKTENPEHMRDNANLGFVISEEDMDTLKHTISFQNYGEYSYFPVFSGK